MDSITMATQALQLAESKLSELTELVEEEIENTQDSYLFARWTDSDDDGPYAA